jgi:hypothetical protein
MKENEHYGIIPGTGTKERPAKPTLLKPGAEKLCLLFRLDPQYAIVDKTENPSLIRFTICCTLYHIPTGLRVASGLGSCNSSEDKYTRPAPKKCPVCGGAFLINGNPEYEKDAAFKGGMLCYKKKGGCGAKFKPTDESITKQPTEAKDPADLHNTILKMACKRALIAAVLNATAASDFFTQDLEDLNEKAAEYLPPTDDLKEKLEKSVKERSAPKAASSRASDADAANGASTHTTITTSPANDASGTEDGGTQPIARGIAAPGDNGEAATDGQKEAIRMHIRKKGWKRGFVRVWFAEIFDIPPSTPDPVEFLTQMQADAAHFLILAHGTDAYRQMRMEYADQGLVRRDENDVQF